MSKQVKTMTDREWAEKLAKHPELADQQVPWDLICIQDWELLLASQPHLEKFRRPPGSPYELLSIEELIDLHQEFLEDMKKFKNQNQKNENSNERIPYRVFANDQ